MVQKHLFSCKHYQWCNNIPLVLNITNGCRNIPFFQTFPRVAVTSLFFQTLPIVAETSLQLQAFPMVAVTSLQLQTLPIVAKTSGLSCPTSFLKPPFLHRYQLPTHLFARVSGGLFIRTSCICVLRQLSTVFNQWLHSELEMFS